MPTVDVDGATIPYTVHGEGPALVLIHGTGPGAPITWSHLIDHFSAAHTVLVPDLSGSEAAIDQGGPLSLETLASQVLAVLDDAGVHTASLVGFSLGAPVAVTVAASAPERVAKLVLAAGWSDSGDEYVRNFMTVWEQLAGQPETFGRFAALTAFSGSYLNLLGHDGVEALIPNMQPTPNLLRQIALNQRVYLGDALKALTAPTLIIGATWDRTIPVNLARDLHAAIPGSRYAELDSGHVLVLERPREFVELVGTFLRDDSA